MTTIKGIHYAVQIFSETDDDWYADTDADVGLVDGVFQFVTDNPGYDGSTVIPKYSIYEINIDGNALAHGSPLVGDNITSPFKDGFFQQDPFTSDPERSIDIVACGSYSTDSAFGFKIRNDVNIWAYCKANNISFTGRRCVMWVIIDDVFYQCGRGRIVNNPGTETDYNFDVQDDANLIHKMIPPLTTNPTNNPSVIDSSAGQTIPVIFGDVPKTKLLKLGSSNTFIELNKFDVVTGLNSSGIKYTLAASSIYDTPSANPIAGPWILKLIVTKKMHIEIDQLKGYYLSVAIGDSNISTKQIYKIIGNGSTELVTSLYPYVELPVYLASPLLKDDGTVHASWDCTHGEVPPGIYFEPSDHYKPNTTHGFIYWFQISNYAISTQLSNNVTASLVREGSGDIKVYEFDDTLKDYVDISQVARINSSGNKIDLISNKSTLDGQSFIYQPLDLELTSFGLQIQTNSGGGPLVNPQYTIEQYSDAVSIALVTDKDRATGKTMNKIFTVEMTYHTIFADFKPKNITIDSSSSVYFCVDFDVVNRSATAEFGLSFIQWISTDIYGNEHRGPVTAGPSSDLHFTGPSNPNNNHVNLIPNDCMKNVLTADSSNIFGVKASTSGATYKTVLEITDTSIFSNPNTASIRVRLFFIRHPFTDGSTFKIKIKDIALIEERSIDTIKGDLYTKATGELTGTAATSAGHATNDVYHTFMHILEDCDGIPKSLIDYGTLATDRINWHVGRTLTERKNSIAYLAELCSHSFVAMFTTRTGKRGLRSINPDTTLVPEVTHDLNIIGRDSIESFDLTDISQLFNNFLLQYNFDPGLQAFVRSFVVANVEMFAAFPDPHQSIIDTSLQTTSTTSITIANNVNKTLTVGTGLTFTPSQIVLIKNTETVFMYCTIVSYDSGTGVMVVAIQATMGAGTFSTWTVGLFSQPLWYLCFGGLLGSADFPTTGYGDSKTIWDKCRLSYKVNRVVRQSQNDISQLNWFIDRALFDEDSTWGTGNTSSVYYLLKILAQWVTLQKALITYSIPINSTTITLDLMRIIGVKDVIYTNNETRLGYIVGILPVTVKDQLRLTVLLMPENYTAYPAADGLDETDDTSEYVDSFDETGDIDTYVDSLLE
jgi:hypothetical protein